MPGARHASRDTLHLTTIGLRLSLVKAEACRLAKRRPAICITRLRGAAAHAPSSDSAKRCPWQQWDRRATAWSRVPTKSATVAASACCFGGADRRVASWRNGSKSCSNRGGWGRGGVDVVSQACNPSHWQVQKMGCLKGVGNGDGMRSSQPHMLVWAGWPCKLSNVPTTSNTAAGVSGSPSRDVITQAHMPQLLPTLQYRALPHFSKTCACIVHATAPATTIAATLEREWQRPTGRLPSVWIDMWPRHERYPLARATRLLRGRHQQLRRDSAAVHTPGPLHVTERTPAPNGDKSTSGLPTALDRMDMASRHACTAACRAGPLARASAAAAV